MKVLAEILLPKFARNPLDPVFSRRTFLTWAVNATNIDGEIICKSLQRKTAKHSSNLSLIYWKNSLIFIDEIVLFNDYEQKRSLIYL